MAVQNEEDQDTFPRTGFFCFFYKSTQNWLSQEGAARLQTCRRAGTTTQERQLQEYDFHLRAALLTFNKVEKRDWNFTEGKYELMTHLKQRTNSPLSHVYNHPIQ